MELLILIVLLAVVLSMHPVAEPVRQTLVIVCAVFIVLLLAGYLGGFEFPRWRR